MGKTKTESIRERIKTFEDAVEATGMTLPFSEEQMAVLPKDVVAYMKLRIIAAALNGLTKDTLNEFPKFSEDEYRYYPYFSLLEKVENIETGGENKHGEGFVSSFLYVGFFSSNGYDARYGSSTNRTARLAVKTPQNAHYFGFHFASIWYDYIVS